MNLVVDVPAQPSGEASESTPAAWGIAAGLLALGGILLIVSAFVTIASGLGFSFSLWDFYTGPPVGDRYLEGVAPWLVAFGGYACVLSILIALMTVRRAAPGLRRALSYTAGVGGVVFFGVTISILRLDIWGLAGVSTSTLFSLLAFAGALLVAVGGMLGALFGISNGVSEGTGPWLFVSVRGRISRQGWWAAYIAYLALAYALIFTLATITVWLLLPLWFLLVYVAICIDGKRWHDRGRSAWWVALYAIPLVGWVWALVELGFLRGTPGANQFGEGHIDLRV